MKLVIIGALVFFVGFWMVEAPGSLADVTQESLTWVWDMTTMIFTAVIDFLGQLFN